MKFQDWPLMSKENKLIPELRFPEFLGKDTWKSTSLSQVLIEHGSKSEGNEEVYSVSVHKGVVNQIEHLGRRFAASNTTNYKRVLAGDIIYTKSPTGDFPYGIIKQSKVSKPVIVSPLYGVFTPETNWLGLILDAYFESRERTFNYLASIVQKGAKNTINIRNDVFLSKHLVLPRDKQEQQKIASCLSSLDELIDANNDKLEALKDHKKGLMQNLFPQEGQNVPNYRFPEFEDDGEWVEKKLGSIGEPLMCKRIFKEQTTPNPENGIPFYKIGTFGKEPDSYIPVELYEEFKSKYNFPNKGDILISASGTIGRLVIYDGEPAYFQDSNIVWLGHDGKQVKNEFLFYCYSIVSWQTSDGGVIKRLYNSDLKNISICFPVNEKEQQKIASCLTAIDKIITAQEEKIEQLQKHKKGLMQGLFPKINK